jgi:hypothetical protein
VWVQDEESWDGVPMVWEMDDGLDVESLAIHDAISEDFFSRSFGSSQKD